MQEKKAIRKEYLALRNSLSKEELYENSKKITKAVVETLEYENTNTIYLYKAYKNEVLCDELFEKALEDGKRTAFPRVFGEDMKFYYVDSLDDFEEGYFGILEPKISLEEVQITEGVIIVPGTVFDKEGYRIGYGKGFYDRFLAQNHQLYSIGIAHSIQMVDKIAIDEYDQKLNMIVTEKKNYRIH